MKSAIFLSVRNKATRLPGKVLLDLGGKSVTERLIQRLLESKEADLVVVTTSPHPDDAILGEIAERCGVAVFYGSEDDKLDRYLGAAQHFGVDVAAIVDGDDPFCDPAYIDRLIRAAREGDADFITVNGLPVGATANLVRVSALAKVCQIKTEHDTEVWGGYFTQTGLFRPQFLEADPAHHWPDLRMTLDYPEDYAFFAAVSDRLQQPDQVFTLDEILALLRQHPEIVEINRARGGSLRRQSAAHYQNWCARGGTRVKFLIIGLGSMGKRRVRNLKHLGAGEVIGFDPRLDRRAEAAEKYGIHTVATIDEGFALQPDAVVISTPPDLHMPYALEAARRGVHFFTEASVVDDGIDELLAICASQPGLVGVPSCTMRYYPGPRQIEALVRAGEIGEVRSFVYQTGQWLPDWHPWKDHRTFYVSKRITGACREIVPFELTWLTNLFGNVAAVQAYTAKLSDLEADIDDIYQCLFQFDSGVAGFLQMDVLARTPVRHFRLLGSEGTIEWEASSNEVRIFRVSTGEWERFSLKRGTVEANYAEWAAEEPYINEMRDFVAAIHGERPYGYTYAEDGVILRVMEAAETSSAEGRRVHLAQTPVAMPVFALAAD